MPFRQIYFFLPVLSTLWKLRARPRFIDQRQITETFLDLDKTLLRHLFAGCSRFGIHARKRSAKKISHGLHEFHRNYSVESVQSVAGFWNV
jgi:hypothetical protein